MSKMMMTMIITRGTWLSNIWNVQLVKLKEGNKDNHVLRHVTTLQLNFCRVLTEKILLPGVVLKI